MQCCGTLMIYCGSGSDFGKVPVSDPSSGPQFFNKILLFSVRSSFVSQNIGLKFFLFCDFCVPFFWIRIQTRFRNRKRNALRFWSGSSNAKSCCAGSTKHCRNGMLRKVICSNFLRFWGESYFTLEGVCSFIFR